MNDDSEKGRLGSSFDDFLREQGTYEATTEQAVKRVIAHQIALSMREQNISKAEMARRLETSRSQIDRLLDPAHDGVSLSVLARAASAVGRKLHVELI